MSGALPAKGQLIVLPMNVTVALAVDSAVTVCDSCGNSGLGLTGLSQLCECGCTAQNCSAAMACPHAIAATVSIVAGKGLRNKGALLRIGSSDLL